jgi:hypothetical protein
VAGRVRVFPACRGSVLVEERAANARGLTEAATTTPEVVMMVPGSSSAFSIMVICAFSAASARLSSSCSCSSFHARWSTRSAAFASLSRATMAEWDWTASAKDWTSPWTKTSKRDDHCEPAAISRLTKMTFASLICDSSARVLPVSDKEGLTTLHSSRMRRFVPGTLSEEPATSTRSGRGVHIRSLSVIRPTESEMVGFESPYSTTEGFIKPSPRARLSPAFRASANLTQDGQATAWPASRCVR